MKAGLYAPERLVDVRDTPLDQEKTALSLLTVIDEGKFPRAVGAGRRELWEARWQGNLDAFRASDDPAALWPVYPSAGDRIIRYCGRWVRSWEEDVERAWFTRFQEWLYCAFLTDAERIIEFGCGPGHNVLAFASRTTKDVIGVDWTLASVAICDLLRAKGLSVYGRLANLRDETYSGVPELPGSDVVTMATGLLGRVLGRACAVEGSWQGPHRPHAPDGI